MTRLLANETLRRDMGARARVRGHGPVRPGTPGVRYRAALRVGGACPRMVAKTPECQARLTRSRDEGTCHRGEQVSSAPTCAGNWPPVPKSSDVIALDDLSTGSAENLAAVVPSSWRAASSTGGC